MPASRAMTRPEWAMLLILSTLWGGSFFFNQIALREVPVLSLVAARVALAAVILLAVLRLRGIALPRGRIWGAFLAMGLLNNVLPFTLIVHGQQQIASGVAAILNASTPLFTVIIAHVLTEDERITPARLAGVIAGFAGVAVMIGGEALGGLGLHVGAQRACLGAALSYAFAGIYGRRFRAMGSQPLQTAMGQLAASAAILIPLALIVDRPFGPGIPSINTLGAIAGLAALSTALAYVLYFRLLATVGASNLVLVTFLVPVSAILLGSVFLDEVLRPRHFVGMALIGLGLAAIDGRLPRRLAAITRRGGGAPG